MGQRCFKEAVNLKRLINYNITVWNTSRLPLKRPFPLSTNTARGGGVGLLTVSDKAMQTNVNFLMWAAVTVLLVLTSLLLGLF